MSDFGVPFPHTPYPLQTTVMKHLMQCFVDKTCALISSPTGTGKTLMVLTVALRWLTMIRSGDTKEPLGDLPLSRYEWLAQAVSALNKSETSQDVEAYTCFLQSCTALAKAYSDATRLEEYRLRVSPMSSEPPLKITNRYDQLLRALKIDSVSGDDLELLSLPYGMRKASHDVKRLEAVRGRVLIASRTHAQLGQFSDSLGSFPNRKLTHVTLGSRDLYCVHPGRVPDMEDTVDDFCDTRRASSGGCPLHRIDTEFLLLAKLLADSRNASEVTASGRDIGACPYYTTRLASHFTDIVFLTHAQLLDELADGSLGLLHGRNVSLVVDEAHSLPDLNASRRGAAISQTSLRVFQQALLSYITEKRAILGATYLRELEYLVAVLGRLLKPNTMEGTRDVSVFLERCGLSTLSLSRPLGLARERHLVHRLRAHSEQLLSIFTGHSVLNFLMTLHTAASASDCFVYRRTDDTINIACRPPAAGSGVKGIMQPFLELAEMDLPRFSFGAAFVSGTLEPIVGFHRALFGSAAGVASTLAVGHIVPPSNVLCLLCPSLFGARFRFTFENRTDKVFRLIASIVLILLNGKPGSGSVVFLPSYAIMERVLEEVEDKDAVVAENATVQTSDTLGAYKRILKEKSAVLLAVTGGRVSEGMDLRDNLCRRLVVIGIPYPSPQDPVVVECNRVTEGRWSHDRAMQLINQSLGRCIRHAHDWASVLLLDERFLMPKVTQALSGWIRNSCRRIADVSEYVKYVTEFESAHSSSSTLANTEMLNL